jgi:amino acid transporter
MLGNPGRILMLVCLPVSVLGGLAIGTLGGSRALLMAAEDGMLPKIVGSIHPEFRTPHVAILINTGMECLLAITGAFQPLAVLSSAALLLVYLGVCLGALRLRYTHRERSPGSFRAPGGPLIPVLGAATVIWLLAHSKATEAVATGSALVIATVYYHWRRGTLRAE